MSACDFPEITTEGVNITASRMLDEHHEVVGVSGYGDDIMDNCEVCGAAAGWAATEPGPETFGHATQFDVTTVARLLEACGQPTSD